MKKNALKLLFCLALLTVIAVPKAYAAFYVAYEGIVPGANCLIHCASSCWCQATADTPIDCAAAASICCGREGCNGVGNLTYSVPVSGL
jgi:hypothetical protein